MRREDIEKLLGGYASDTLTAGERKALFEAALNDQALFDSLADEQALKEVFDDPACRTRLVRALEPKPAGFWAWLRRPPVWALAGGLAGTALIAVVLTRSAVPPLPRPEMTMRAPAAAVAPAPSAPEPREAKPAPQRKAAVKKERSAAEHATGGMAGGVGGAVSGVGTAGGRAGAASLPEPPAVMAMRKFEPPMAAAAPPPPPPPAMAAAAPAASPNVATPAPEMSRFAAAEQADVRASAISLRVAPLSYTVQKRLPDGGYADTAGTNLTASDSVRLMVRSGAGGYLYVLWRAASGNWRLVFPAEGAADGANRLEEGGQQAVPSDGALRFDGEPGDKRILLVLATQAEPGFRTGPLEPLIARLKGEPSRRMLPAAAATGIVPGAAAQAPAPRAVVRELTLTLRP